ncbi:MAG TPA: type I 3-dehydroquinate dehydratase [Chthoniobacterales bacterium]
MTDVIGFPSALRKHAVVGVLGSSLDLETALEVAPGSFGCCELRIDLLAGAEPETLERARVLSYPKIVTVRDPAEGGAHYLSLQQRRHLFEQWIPASAFIDVELRNLRALEEIVHAAKAQGSGIIVSCHDFERTPSLPVLQDLLGRAQEGCPGAVFKVATRTESWADVQTLAALLGDSAQEIAVMGMGPLGKLSRLIFAKLGSRFTYAAMAASVAAGQWQVEQLARVLAEI